MRHVYKFLALVLFSGAVSADYPIVQLPSSHLKPGQTLSVISTEKRFKNTTLHWGDQSVPFYRTMDNRWRALMRVPLDAEPKQTELFIRRARKKTASSFQISVSKSNFGFETIRFPEEKAKLLNDASEDEESQLIRKFLPKAAKDKKQHWDGPFIKPVPGKMSSPFGIKRNKVGQIKPDFHRGIDLNGALGEPIVAPAGGRVLMVKDFKFHGKTVLLSHGQGVGSITIHMNAINVKKGEWVAKGQQLGEVGASGLATAPHLHWGVYVHGKAVDPVQWLEESF